MHPVGKVSLRRILLMCVPGSILVVNALVAVLYHRSEPYAFGCHKGLMHYEYDLAFALPVLGFAAFVAAVAFPHYEEEKGDLYATFIATLVAFAGASISYLVAFGERWESFELLRDVVF